MSLLFELIGRIVTAIVIEYIKPRLRGRTKQIAAEAPRRPQDVRERLPTHKRGVGKARPVRSERNRRKRKKRSGRR